jgi:O-antigen ligase
MKNVSPFEITCAKLFSLILLLQINIINKYVYIPNISFVLGFLLALSILSYYLRTGISLNKIFPLEIWLYLLFGVFALVTGFLVAINRSVLINSVMTYFQTVIYMVCLLAIIRFDKNLFYLEFLIVCTAFLVSLVVLSGVSSISTALAGREEMFKNSIVKVNPNSVGLLQSAAFLFQIIWLKRLKNNRERKLLKKTVFLKILVLFLMVVTLLVILISGSRKSMIAAVLALAMSIVFSAKGSVLQKIVGIIISLILIGIVFYVGQIFFEDVYIFRRFSTFFDESSNTTRINMIREGFLLLAKSPIIGVGLGNYTYASSFGTYSHNTVAEVFATTGLLGASLYLLTYFIIFYKLVKLTDDNRSRQFAFDGIVLFGVLVFLSVGVIHFYEILSSLLFTYLIAGSMLYKKMGKNIVR